MKNDALETKDGVPKEMEYNVDVKEEMIKSDSKTKMEDNLIVRMRELAIDLEIYSKQIEGGDISTSAIASDTPEERKKKEIDSVRKYFEDEIFIGSLIDAENTYCALDKLPSKCLKTLKQNKLLKRNEVLMECQVVFEDKIEKYWRNLSLKRKKVEKNILLEKISKSISRENSYKSIVITGSISAVTIINGIFLALLKALMDVYEISVNDGATVSNIYEIATVTMLGILIYVLGYCYSHMKSIEKHKVFAERMLNIIDGID